MMKKHFCGVMALALLAFPLYTQKNWPEPDAKLLERARALLREAPLIEGHNDLATSIMRALDGDSDRVDLSQRQPQLSADIPRLREGLKKER